MITKKEKIFSLLVFIIYCVLLTWLVLFKLSVNFEEILNINMRNLNLIPFKESVIINGRISIEELVFNILVFVPFGVYIQIFKWDWKIYKKVLIGFIVSIGYEVIQFVFAMGASDITDVINNTLGCFIGLILFLVLRKIFDKKNIVIINIIGLIIEVVGVLFIILLTIANS